MLANKEEKEIIYNISQYYFAFSDKIWNLYNKIDSQKILYLEDIIDEEIEKIASYMSNIIEFFENINEYPVPNHYFLEGWGQTFEEFSQYDYIIKDEIDIREFIKLYDESCIYNNLFYDEFLDKNCFLPLNNYVSKMLELYGLTFDTINDNLEVNDFKAVLRRKNYGK